MRKLLLLCATAAPLLVLAETVRMNKEVVCDDSTTLIEHLKSKEKEQPIFVGNVNPSELIVLVNPVTLGWSVLQTNGTKACMLAVGKGFKYREPTINSAPTKLVLK